MLVSVTGIVVAPAARLKVREATGPLAMIEDVMSLATQVSAPGELEQDRGLAAVAAVAVTETTLAAG